MLSQLTELVVVDNVGGIRRQNTIRMTFLRRMDRGPFFFARYDFIPVFKDRYQPELQA